MTVLYVLAALVVGVVLGGLLLTPKPQLPAPPKAFGLAELESVKTAVGGYKAGEGRMLQLACGAVGVKFTAPAEIVDARKSIAVRVSANTAIIEALKEQIMVRENNTATALGRDSELAELSTTLGL